MKSLSELIAEYVASGCTYDDAYRRAKRYMYNHRRYMEQKAIHNAINQLKVDDPVKYKELVYKVEHAEEIAAQKRADAQRLYEERKRLKELEHFKFDHGLVVAGVPDIDFSGVEGMIAFRTWNVKSVVHYETGEQGSNLVLGSTAMASFWEPMMIADIIPTVANNSGLYCVKLDPLGLMTRASYYLGEVCGLLELRGRILEHSDGVVRAEWARIICVFIQASKETESVYEGLRQSYPTISMYVLHKEQIAEILLRVTVMQGMRGE